MVDGKKDMSCETTLLLRPDSYRPPTVLVHAAIWVAYACFGGGAVISKFALATVNPLTFELNREILSALALFAMSAASSRQFTIAIKDLHVFILASVCLYCNQVLFFLGLHFTEAVLASLWSATLPIFVMILSMTCGYERFTRTQMLGVLITVIGTLIIPFSSGQVASADPTSHRQWWIIGNAMFLLGILGCSGYIIASGDLTKKYPAMFVTGCCFFGSSSLVFSTAQVVRQVPQLLDAICKGRVECIEHPWYVSSAAVPCLGYEVIVCTLTAWYFLTWSTRFAKPYVTSIYTAVQPLTASGISWVLHQIMTSEWLLRYQIQKPHWTHLLAAAIIAFGLAVSFASGCTTREQEPIK